ncbi:hypothetical protein [Telmatospirillum sp. J64-1]|uniref:hypothetical protein n=1 Tax=Telmatospirillum sp. J64-1 TaxID=2502183 RepID=UPI00115F3874|nr:hypothetical protein [Telmatospirillum sp. J64-1]
MSDFATSGVSGNMTIAQVTGGMDLEAFMMTVQAQRAENLESQMADQINEIKQRQAEVAHYNDMLAALRQERPEGKPDAKTTVSKDLLNDMIKAGLKDAGENVTTATQIKYDNWIEQVKAKLDNLNSTSQLDMIRLQSLSNKRNEAFEQLTNAVQKFAKARESIIGNMR